MAAKMPEGSTARRFYPDGPHRRLSAQVIKALRVSPNVRSRRRSLPSAAQVTPGAPKVDQNTFRVVRELSIGIAQLSQHQHGNGRRQPEECESVTGPVLKSLANRRHRLSQARRLLDLPSVWGQNLEALGGIRTFDDFRRPQTQATAWPVRCGISAPGNRRQRRAFSATGYSPNRVARSSIPPSRS